LPVSYSALYRFARKWCGFGTPSISVRRAESLPGEMAEADFGRLGPLQELGSCQPRVVQGFILTLGYSRLSCAIPVFKQDLPTVIDCFERAWAFFGGCPWRVVIDGMKAGMLQAFPMPRNRPPAPLTFVACIYTRNKVRILLRTALNSTRSPTRDVSDHGVLSSTWQSPTAL
jgi:hypothetical protein